MVDFKKLLTKFWFIPSIVLAITIIITLICGSTCNSWGCIGCIGIALIGGLVSIGLFIGMFFTRNIKSIWKRIGITTLIIIIFITLFMMWVRGF